MRPLKKDNDTITLTREQAKNLIKEIAFVAEASFRRGAEHSVAVKLSERDAYFYRRYGQTIDKKLSGSLHVTAYQMPSSGVGKNLFAIGDCVEMMQWRSFVGDFGPFKQMAYFADLT